MKSGTCPKCGSHDIHNGGKRLANGITVMNISTFSRALLDNLVCIKCGYTESYVIDESKRSEIQKKWPKFSKP